LIFRWLEDSLAVGASPFDHTAKVAREPGPFQAQRLRNCCRVGTASWPMAVFFDYKTGGIAVVLFRRQQSGKGRRRVP
jgi:hypothetical protein